MDLIFNSNIWTTNRHFLNWTTSSTAHTCTEKHIHNFFGHQSSSYFILFFPKKKIILYTCLSWCHAVGCSRTKSIQFVLITNVRVNVCLHGILILCFSMYRTYTHIWTTFPRKWDGKKLISENFERFLTFYSKST